jgi:3-hydroxyacyl-CoA dehydrogenase/enoyl-CoA hydratase/3-hydroxybutyryl-CoA epimerase
LAFCREIKKTAIVVNDGYGFYTTRVFTAYVMEAAELVATGHDPVLVEYAARSAGMVVPPLKVFDEVTLTLAAHAVGAREAHTGEKMDSAGLRLVRRMVELGRGGKAAGQGFYDYTAKPRRLWSGLREMAESVPAPEETGLERIRERLMLAQALEAARCLEEGVLRSTRDAEIGAIFGVGFAPGSGGPLAWLDRFGQRRAVTALDALAAQHGARYAPNAALRAMAESGARFFDAV